MIGQASGHSGGSMNPMTTTFGDPQGQSEGVMIGTEIVDTPHQKHTSFKGLDMPSQMASASRQARQALAENERRANFRYINVMMHGVQNVEALRQTTI